MNDSINNNLASRLNVMQLLSQLDINRYDLGKNYIITYTITKDHR